MLGVRLAVCGTLTGEDRGFDSSEAGFVLASVMVVLGAGASADSISPENQF